MIPEFPEFKSLELKDKEEITQATSMFEPYSDFNFTSLWSWNLSDEIEISKIHNNLVVKFTDYITSEPFYSFIGTNSVEKTIETLLHHSKQLTITPELQLIPKPSIDGVNTSSYKITESEEHFDYIYKTDELRQFKGRKFAKKRTHVNNFLKEFPNAEHRKLNLVEPKTQKEIIDVINTLDEQKRKKSKEGDTHNLPVLLRLLKCIDICNIVATGIFVDNKLVAVLINEYVGDGFAIGHIMSADTVLHKGLYTYLMKQNSEILFQDNVHLFNFEQDLGLENLRIAKRRFRPTSFLKKYKVSYHHKG